MTEISAIDVRNKNHLAVSKVFVLPPHDLAFLPSVVEVQIGGLLSLPLRLTVKLPITNEVVCIRLVDRSIKRQSNRYTYLNLSKIAKHHVINMTNLLIYLIQIVPVTDCRGLPFVITSSDNAIFEYSPELGSDLAAEGSGACQMVHVKAAGVQGFTQIGASLTATKDATLMAEATTAAFKPLQPVS